MRDEEHDSIKHTLCKKGEKKIIVGQIPLIQHNSDLQKKIINPNALISAETHIICSLKKESLTRSTLVVSCANNEHKPQEL